MIERVSAFNWLSKPDICIRTKDKPCFVAVEVKLGHEERKRGPIKSGIGQAVIYSSQYDYTVLFCLLRVKFEAGKHEYDERIKSALWDKHKIKVIIRYEPS
jgi:hypothetical protein